MRRSCRVTISETTLSYVGVPKCGDQRGHVLDGTGICGESGSNRRVEGAHRWWPDNSSDAHLQGDKWKMGWHTHRGFPHPR